MLGNLDMFDYFWSSYGALAVPNLVIKKCASFAAQFGHIDLVPKILEKANFLNHMAVQMAGIDPGPLYLEAAKQADLDHILACFSDKKPTKKELEAILITAIGCERTSMTVVKYCIENGADLGYRSDVKFYCEIAITKYLQERFPPIVEVRKESIVFNACLHAELDAFEFLHEQGWLREELFVKLASFPSSFGIAYQHLHRHHYRSTSLSRFECLKFLHAKGFSKKAQNVTAALVWANYDQLLWLLDNYAEEKCFRNLIIAKGDLYSKSNYSALELYLASHREVDLRIVGLLLDLGVEVSTTALIECLYLDNGVEFLQFLFEKLGAKVVAAKADRQLLNKFPSFSSFLLANVRGILEYTLAPITCALFPGLFDCMLPKLRASPHKFVKVVQCFVAHGFPGFESEAEATKGLLAVNHEPFHDEIIALFDS